MTEISWPPPYTLRKHRLAKHVKLRATHSEGLEITIPMRFNVKEIPTILEEHKIWITKQLAALNLQQNKALPDSIIFNATNETWKIFYVECHSKLAMISRPQNEIVLIGKIHNQNLCKSKIVLWIKEYAKTYLTSELTRLSLQTQLDFDNFIVRDQKTRWGSCTSKKSISLNYKLIFLPYRLLKHVIIHELCHTKHLNHSNQFWNEVALHDVDWRIHRNELRHANQYIPTWMLD